MVATRYIPERGDIVWVDFSPQKGHEQAGRRPALVLSPRKFNESIGLALCCPITSLEKHRTFEVSITLQKIKGAVLADHARSFDWRARKFVFIEKVADGVVQRIGSMLAKIAQGE